MLRVAVMQQQYIGKEVSMDRLKFKGYCAEHGIKQAEISELLNITVSNVNEKINGKQEFTLEQVRTLCKKYGISADVYFI